MAILVLVWGCSLSQCLLLQFRQGRFGSLFVATVAFFSIFRSLPRFVLFSAGSGSLFSLRHLYASYLDLTLSLSRSLSPGPQRYSTWDAKRSPRVRFLRLCLDFHGKYAPESFSVFFHVWIATKTSIFFGKGRGCHTHRGCECHRC